VSLSQPSPTRAIVCLAIAGFAGQSMVRVSDTLLPQIAADMATTVGAASIVVTAYAFTHSSIQLIVGPIGDRFGKYKTIAIATALSAIIVLLCGLANSLTTLALARLASGATAAWIIPLAIAYVGDVIPYERRQQVLARFLSGQISGQLFGQAAGGILGDLIGWRNVFFLLAALFAIAAAALINELVNNPLTQAQRKSDSNKSHFISDYASVLGNPWARIILVAVLIESTLTFGAFTYIGADLHLRFGLSFTMVGTVVATFGLGGLLYTVLANRLVPWLGQSGLVLYGSIILAVAFVLLAAEPTWWLAPVAVSAIGLGFYMMHNTLQTNATQMTPEARGTAVAIFAAALYFGQTIGVAAAAPIVDRLGAPIVFGIAALGFPILGFWLSRLLNKKS
jgi:predicted MFS family arabinose efflux permease